MNLQPAEQAERPADNRPRSSSPGSKHPSSPTQLGYRMPAEWEPHQATWLSWPHCQKTWAGRVKAIHAFYAEVIRAIVADEPVHINVNDITMEQLARDVLKTHHVSGEILFHLFPTDNAWCRDHGATIVVHRDSESAYPTRVAIDWRSSSGGRQEPRMENNIAIASKMAQALQVPCVSGGMVLDGGCIDANGTGLLLAANSCLSKANRNPPMSVDQIQERLATMIGIERTIWLTGRITGDETGSHVDTTTRFVDSHTVVTVLEKNPEDKNFEPLRENYRLLKGIEVAEGTSLHVETLPMPPPIFARNKQLPASYANFYLTNHSVLVPQFGQSTDQEACQKLAALFSGRRIVGINCRDAVQSGGSLHRMTQQIPVA